jgi:hypothetical protein
VYGGSTIVSQIDADTLGVSFSPALDNVDCWDITAGGDGTGTVTVGALKGDVDGNKNTNGADITAIKPNLGAAVSGANFRMDVDANGFINGADITQIKPLLGGSIVCP